MKTTKEIQLATHNFIKASEGGTLDSIEGTFIPADKSVLYKKNRYNILLGLSLLGTSFLLLYQVFWVEFDLPIVIYIVASLAALLLGMVSLIPILQWMKIQEHIKEALGNEHYRSYGVLLTDEYYFEYTFNDYHVIPRANIIRIDYEESRSNNELYVELLVDIFDSIQVRSVVYNPSLFDLKAWINGTSENSSAE